MSFTSIRKRSFHTLVGGVLGAIVAAMPAMAQERTTITQLGFAKGAGTLVVAHGVRQLVNKNAKNIRVEIQPGRGGQNLLYWHRRPERRSKLFIDLITHDVFYPKPQNQLKAIIALFPNAGWALVTTDPKIKTLRDFKGKVVDAAGILRNSSGQMLVASLKRLGVDVDSVDLSKQTRSMSDRVAQLADGITDVAMTGIINKRQVSPPFAKLMRTRRVYLVDQDAKAMEKLAPATYPYAICAGDIQKQYKLDYDPNQGRKVYAMYVVPSTWASLDVSEAIVYEYVKTVIDHRKELVNYIPRFGKALATQLGHIPIAQSSFHPGAQRAFREAGMSFGLEGIRAWEAKQPNMCR